LLNAGVTYGRLQEKDHRDKRSWRFLGAEALKFFIIPISQFMQVLSLISILDDFRPA
jgi:hypothetical protein